MSGYSYKGVSVNNICVNNGSTANVGGFSGMPATSVTNYSSMRPLTFGYTTGNPPVDICNQYAAPNTGIITTSGNHSIPTGVKSCRVISVGGGGGNGGGGGSATAESYNGTSSTDGGGAGGSGGYGSYIYSNISLTGYSSIYVYTGASGTNGNAGSNQKVNSNYTPVPAGYNNNKTTNVNDGNAGNAGGYSYIILNGTNNWVAAAAGGNGGGGGGAASANASENKATSNGGSAGAAGTPTTTQANDSNYPTLTNYGNPDTQGAVQIIWLYD